MSFFKKLLAQIKSLFKKEKKVEEVAAPSQPPIISQPPVQPPAPKAVDPTLPPAPGPIVGLPLEYPKDVVRSGARYRIAAPLAEDWVGAGTDAAWFPVNGPAICNEYDVGRLSKPVGARSPRGYPLLNGRIYFAGKLFENEASLGAYLTSEQERDANLKQWGRLWGRVYNVPAKGIKAVDLTRDDVFALDAFQLEYDRLRTELRASSAFASLAWLVVEGAAVEVNRVINYGSYNRPKDFDLNAYQGPVREVVQFVFDRLRSGNPIVAPMSVDQPFVDRQARYEQGN